MTYQRTQVYLDPEEHRKLVAEAASRGISLAALLREIVASHVGERAAPYEAKGFESIIGIIRSDKPTDVARFGDEYMAEAMDELYRKKMGLEPKRARRRTSSGRPKRR